MEEEDTSWGHLLNDWCVDVRDRSRGRPEPPKPFGDIVELNSGFEIDLGVCNKAAMPSKGIKEVDELM